VEGDAALDIIEKSVVLVGLGDSEYVHNSDWEFDVTSDFIVDFDSSFFVLDNDVGFARSKSDSETVPGWGKMYLRMTARGRHSLSLCGP
jgi:hypothetical protein